MTTSRSGLAGGSPVIPTTHFLVPDEKAYWLLEDWRPVPILGPQRVQRVWVLRGDAIVLHERGLGAWDSKRDHPFQVPSFWEYSVAELQEIAQRCREEKVPTEPEQPIDLLAVWAEELDERRMRRDHLSTSGPILRKER